MTELVAIIQNKYFIRQSMPMSPGAPHDPDRYCAFHKDKGHDIEQCRHLRSLVEELIKVEKLKEFVLAYP